ncbi:hypothetical protein [Bacillus wiedmannii]|uniref:hypothetical protein n=1 Tax=Bacillus wiedmannii TaxID=1890302 RepID=UPI000BEF3210|nr:hypothetical protein [Bacillus wiedmannii]PEN61584.1 hypothetical protein CN576_21345 [Bacillus wiedmannii]PHA62830.1 hypothetical protein COE75_16450 [Bacillus wiedmannii]
MKFIHDYFIDTCGDAPVVFLEGSILIIASILIGIIVGGVYCSYVMSMVKFDMEHNIKEDGISMIILRKGKRTRIILPPQLTMMQLLMNSFIFGLYRIGILKNSQITIRDVKKAKKIFLLFVIFTALIVITAIILATSIIEITIENDIIIK